jgi:hypothetical protein
MIRVLRRLLRIGLLAGVGVGIAKVVKSRKTPDPWADSWVSTGAPGATRPSPAPVPPAAPKDPGGADLATPPAASPAPPAPDAATEKGDGDGESTDEDSGEPAPKATTRSTKASNTGPARKSPTGKAEDPPDERLWVAANEGVCPQSHPIKAKLASKIFHTPASRNYSHTKADRCYPDEASAQADGLRPPQH